LYELTWRGGTYSLNANDNGKPWFVRFGGQYHTGYGLSNLYDVNGGYFFLTGANRQTYWGNTQYYAMAEAMLYREPGSYNRGLTAFLKGKWSPWQEKGSTSKGVYGGLAYEGVFGRNSDVLFAGWAMPFVNQGVITRSQNQTVCTQMPNCSVSGWQGTLEVGYSAQITPWLFFTPKLWWVVYPNVRRDLGDIVSAGFELRISF
jgi:carbohydrate-selective porin OprB